MKEHAVVIFIRPFKHEDRVIPVGAKGTIVHIYPEGKAVEVELSEGRLVTVPADNDCMFSTGWRSGEVALMEELVSRLKSGEITLEQIREATDEINRRTATKGE